MKLLLVTLYFPPAGGGGVQRPLKFASHLPALGIETHVLAPDDPKWVHEDADLPLPTQAWIHRARYLGPRSRRLADELHGRSGVDLALRQASSIGRRLLVPDENVTWNATAIPKAISIVRSEGIDVVVTTSPPASVHLIGAAVQAATGVKWVADLRDSLVAHPHRRAENPADRVELIPYVPRRRSLELQRDSDALLLLIPEAGGRGRGVLSGKVFEYLAAERPVLAVVPPDGAAAWLIRETGAGVVAAPDDVSGIRDALAGLHRRWRAGGLDGTPL